MNLESQDCGLAQPILDWFRMYGVVHTAEPSFKLSQGRLSAERGLFGFNKNQLGATSGQSADQVLLDFCADLGMPAALLTQYRHSLGQTGYVGFGFECDGAGAAQTRRYKAYLDLSSQNAVAARNLLSASDSVLQFLGFKWDVGKHGNIGNLAGSGRAVVTEYRAFPLLSRRGMRRRSLELLGTLSPAQAVVESAFARCARDWADRPLEYMEAREQGNPRVSFDIKFYSTSLNLIDLRPELENLADRLGIAQPLQDLLQVHAHSRLGHLAGGLDRNGTPFLMVYHGVKRRVTQPPT